MSRQTLAVILITIAATLYVSHQAAPTPPPRPDRPVLSLLVRLAKLALWTAAFAEPAPVEQHYVAKAVNDDGTRRLDNSEGW